MKFFILQENSHLGEFTETIPNMTDDYKKAFEQVNDRKRSRSCGRPKKHDTSNEKDLQENVEKSKVIFHIIKQHSIKLSLCSVLNYNTNNVKIITHYYIITF